VQNAAFGTCVKYTYQTSRLTLHENIACVCVNPDYRVTRRQGASAAAAVVPGSRWRQLQLQLSSDSRFSIHTTPPHPPPLVHHGGLVLPRPRTRFSLRLLPCAALAAGGHSALSLPFGWARPSSLAELPRNDRRLLRSYETTCSYPVVLFVACQPLPCD
jgi:hypothetical protein